ncbi:hypothetical protein SynA1560_02034 [Synechococcus sp. A15-60]|nr:hypothetical protein SynA1560_02034 [Synechococcus sp. A15-60]
MFNLNLRHSGSESETGLEKTPPKVIATDRNSTTEAILTISKPV